jgi:spore coat polysaccharide biosynthesis predicted glycosyltransferase SpsG
MILFSVSAGKKIGTGHLSRCLHVASWLKREGEEVVFHIVNGGKEQNLLKPSGFKTIKDKELHSLIPQALVIDRLPYEESIAQTFKEKGTKVIIFDAFSSGWEIADVAVNALPHPPYTRKPPTTMLLFEGPSYMPIGEEFKEARKTKRLIKRIAKTVLVSCGGSDPYGVSLKLAEVLSETELSLDIIFIIGKMYNEKKRLKRVVFKKGWKIIENPSSLLPFMLKADFALLTFGLTVYEAACCGLPSLLFPPTKEHLLCAEIFSSYGASINMGLVRDLSPSMIKEKIEKVCKDYNLRLRMSQKAMNIVDGNGARRVAEIILMVTKK